MIRIDLSALINKLNAQTKLALEQAGSLCIDRQHSEVTIAHLMLAILDNPLSDLRILLKALDISPQTMDQLFRQAFSRDGNHDTMPSFSPLLIELLQDAWLIGSTELGDQQLRSGAIFVAALLRSERYLPPNVTSFVDGVNRESLRKHFVRLTQGSAETPVSEIFKGGENTSISTEADSVLNRYCSNVTAMARRGELDPVLCRDNEINLMIDILCRRRKNNPIVVGEAGVGKTALAEGLAIRIVNGQVPDELKKVDLLCLDLALLQAGASIKGEFERRLKAVIDGVKSSLTPIILFIDEAHTLIGAGNQEGGADAANLLKPALARGELRTIAATTWKEYKRYIEKDPALSRRFQLVKINAPTTEQAIDILRGLHPVYEKAHGVVIGDDALRAAAELSARYISGRQLPDKAIDVLDTACARIAINLSTPPHRLAQLAIANIQRQREIDLLSRQHLLGETIDDDRLAALEQECVDNNRKQEELQREWEAQKSLVERIIENRQQLLYTASDSHPYLVTQTLAALYQQFDAISPHQRLIHPHVGACQVGQVIADWTGVPIEQMSQGELTRITHLPQLIAEKIKGQDLALRRIHRHLLTSRADLRCLGRPNGAFLLVGPSGVGKTETVVQIAQKLYGGKQFLTVINMSEYQEKHTISRLIGSPPGYVGYGDGGILTEAIRKMPYSVVLLDEVEKAHPDVLNLFYQAFDRAELADGEGQVIDCQNILFFFTSNLGHQIIVDNTHSPQVLDEKLYLILSDFFKPALLARMETVPFLALEDTVLRDIVIDKLAQLERLLQTRYRAEVIIENGVVDEILRRATRAENGARMLEAVIDGQMLPCISLLLLNKLAASEKVKRIHLTVENHEFVGELQ